MSKPRVHLAVYHGHPAFMPSKDRPPEYWTSVTCKPRGLAYAIAKTWKADEVTCVHCKKRIANTIKERLTR